MSKICSSVIRYYVSSVFHIFTSMSILFQLNFSPLDSREKHINEPSTKIQVVFNNSLNCYFPSVLPADAT